MNMLRQFALSLLLLTTAHAATYYVSATGSDTNNGTTQSTPWKTIAKINASAFQPGDSILFQRGSTWRETLIPPSSGAANNVITFSNYGTGALPVITGADLIASANWTLESTYYYHAAHATLPSGVWNNGTRLTLAASKSALTNSTSWWYDSANQRVYVFNSGTAPSTIEIQTRDYNIDTASNPKSHLVFDGFDLQKARQNFRLYSWSAAASDWTIQDSSLQSEPNPGDISAGVYASGNTGTFNGLTVQNNIFSPWPGTPLTYVNNAYGVYFTGAPGRVPVTNFLIDNNTIGPAGKHGICVWHASIGTVSNNTLGGNSESCIDVKDTPYATITRNRCDNDGEYSIVYHASDTAGSTHDGIVSFNHVTRGGQNQGVDHGHGANQIGDIALHATQNVSVAYNWAETSWGAGIYVNDYASVGGGNNNTVMYNVIANNGTGKPDGGISLGDVANTKVYNNTIYAQANNGTALWLSGGPHTTATDLKNNLFYGIGTGPLINIASAAQTGFSSDYNLYFNTPSALAFTWGSSTLDLPAWHTATSEDAHSLNVDPKFLDASAADLRTDVISPAIDSATTLGATYKSALDPASTFPWSIADQSARGTTWDIGAFVQPSTTTYGRGLGASGWFTMGPNPNSGPTPPPTPSGTLDNDYYCQASELTTLSGTFDGPAQLPTNCVRTAMAATPATGSTVSVTAGSFSDLQTKITNAQCGQIIKVPSQMTNGSWATYAGNLTFPALACPANNWVIVESDHLASLPAEGTRVTPCHVNAPSIPNRPVYSCTSPGYFLPKIIGDSGSNYSVAILSMPSGMSHWRLIGLAITDLPGEPNISNGFVQMGMSDHVILDRSLVYPEDDLTAAPSALTQRVGVRMDGTFQAVVDSYIFNIHSGPTGSVDAFAVNTGSGGSGGNAIKVVDNFMEASGEPFFTGGQSSGGPFSNIVSDIEIRRNHMFKPLSWKSDDPSYAGQLPCNTSSHPSGCYQVKNLFEMKVAERALIESNLLEHTWQGQSDQKGECMVFGPKNANNVFPTIAVRNITVRYNKCSWAQKAVQVAPVNATQGGTSPFEQGYMSFHDNLWDYINYPNATTNPSGSCCTVAIGMVMLSDIQNFHDISFDHNTIIQSVDPAQQATATPSFVDVTGDVMGVTWDDFSWTNNIALGGWKGFGTGGGNGQCINSTGASYTTLGEAAGAGCFTYTPKAQGWCADGNLLATSEFTQQKPNTPLPNPVGALSSHPSPNCRRPLVGNNAAASYAAMQFINFNSGTGGNYRLSASSPYKQSATDGKDPGADIDALEQYLQGVP